MKKNLPSTLSAILLLAFFAMSSSGCSFFLKDAGTAKQKITLTYYRFGEDADVIQPLLQSYQSSHPGTAIQLVTKFANEDQYEDVLLNQIAEGAGPDIFSVPNTWAYKHQKIIAPVPEKAATVDDFRKTFVAVADRDLVRPDTTDPKKLRIFGMPLYIDTLATFYNKVQYEDRIPSRGRPADLWKDLALDSISLTKPADAQSFDVSGAALGRTDNVMHGLDVLYALALQYGGGLYGTSGASLGLGSFTAKSDVGTVYPFSQATAFFSSFATPGADTYTWSKFTAQTSDTEELGTFVNGHVSTIFGYSDTYDKLLKLANAPSSSKLVAVKDIGVAPLPQVYNSQTSSNPRVAYANYNFETVSRNSPNQGAAWDLLLFLGNQKNQQFYNQKTHKPTSRRDLLDSQSKDPVYGVFAQQVGYASSLALYDQPKFDGIMQQLVADMVDRSVILKDAMAAADLRLNLVLPAGGYTGPGPHVAGQK